MFLNPYFPLCPFKIIEKIFQIIKNFSFGFLLNALNNGQC